MVGLNLVGHLSLCFGKFKLIILNLFAVFIINKLTTQTLSVSDTRAPEIDTPFCSLKMVRMSVINDALRSIVNAEKTGKRQVCQHKPLSLPVVGGSVPTRGCRTLEPS